MKKKNDSIQEKIERFEQDQLRALMKMLAEHAKMPDFNPEIISNLEIPEYNFNLSPQEIIDFLNELKQRLSKKDSISSKLNLAIKSRANKIVQKNKFEAKTDDHQTYQILKPQSLIDPVSQENENEQESALNQLLRFAAFFQTSFSCLEESQNNILQEIDVTTKRTNNLSDFEVKRIQKELQDPQNSFVLNSIASDPKFEEALNSNDFKSLLIKYGSSDIAKHEKEIKEIIGNDYYGKLDQRDNELNEIREQLPVLLNELNQLIFEAQALYNMAERFKNNQLTSQEITADEDSINELLQKFKTSIDDLFDEKLIIEEGTIEKETASPDVRLVLTRIRERWKMLTFILMILSACFYYFKFKPKESINNLISFGYKSTNFLDNNLLNNINSQSDRWIIQPFDKDESSYITSINSELNEPLKAQQARDIISLTNKVNKRNISNSMNISLQGNETLITFNDKMFQDALSFAGAKLFGDFEAVVNIRFNDNQENSEDLQNGESITIPYGTNKVIVKWFFRWQPGEKAKNEDTNLFILIHEKSANIKFD